MRNEPSLELNRGAVWTTSDFIANVQSIAGSLLPMQLLAHNSGLQSNHGVLLPAKTHALLVGTSGPKPRGKNIETPTRFFLASEHNSGRSGFNKITEIGISPRDGIDPFDLQMLSGWMIDYLLPQETGYQLNSVPGFNSQMLQLVIEQDGNISVRQPENAGDNSLVFGNAIQSGPARRGTGKRFDRNEPDFSMRTPQERPGLTNYLVEIDTNNEKKVSKLLARAGGLDLGTEFAQIAALLPVADNPNLQEALAQQLEVIAQLEDPVVRQKYCTRLMHVDWNNSPKFSYFYRDMLEAGVNCPTEIYGAMLDRIMIRRIRYQAEANRMPLDAETKAFARQLVLKRSNAEARLSMEGLTEATFCRICQEKLALQSNPLVELKEELLNTTIADIFGGKGLPALNQIINNLEALAAPYDQGLTPTKAIVWPVGMMERFAVDYLRFLGALPYHRESNWKTELGISSGSPRWEGKEGYFHLQSQYTLAGWCSALARLACAAQYGDPTATRIINGTRTPDNVLNKTYGSALDDVRLKDLVFAQLQTAINTMQYLQDYLTPSMI